MKKLTKKQKIEALKSQARKLWADRCFAMDREQACLAAYLRGQGMESRFASWANKRSEIGEAYYGVCDQLCEMGADMENCK